MEQNPILIVIVVASTMIVYTFAMTLFAKDIVAWSTEELKRKLDDTEYVLANREDYILKLEEENKKLKKEIRTKKKRNRKRGK